MTVARTRQHVRDRMQGHSALEVRVRSARSLNVIGIVGTGRTKIHVVDRRTTRHQKRSDENE